MSQPSSAQQRQSNGETVSPIMAKSHKKQPPGQMVQGAGKPSKQQQHCRKQETLRTLLSSTRARITDIQALNASD